MSYLAGHSTKGEGMTVSLGSERIADHELTAALRNAAPALIEERAQLRTELERAESRLREAQAQYDELIYAVAQKWPGETRHQTALRYIQNAERGDAARAADGEKKG